MIRSSQILEEYLTLLRQGDTGYTIFVNPDRSELRELGDDVRFIADAKKKKVYVWNAEILHDEIAEFLHLGVADPKKFWGVATRRGQKYIVNKSDTLVYLSYIHITPRFSSSVTSGHLLEFLSQEWTWLDRYIEATPFILAIAKTLGSFETPS
jgi:hypothetical protein